MRRRLRADRQGGAGGCEIHLRLLPVLLRRALAFKQLMLAFLVGIGGTELGNCCDQIAFGLQHVGGLAAQDRQAVRDGSIGPGERRIRHWARHSRR